MQFIPTMYFIGLAALYFTLPRTMLPIWPRMGAFMMFWYGAIYLSCKIGEIISLLKRIADKNANL